jgi:hypothetical protein
MPETAFAHPTRRDAFEPLLALAKLQVLELVTAHELTPEDGWFLARAVFDLESDGVDLFGAELRADARFYDEVRTYLAARVGPDRAALLTLDGGPDFDRSARGSNLDRDQLDSALIQLVPPWRYA